MMCSPEKTLINVWIASIAIKDFNRIRSFSGTENLNVIFELNGFGKGEESKEFGIVFCFMQEPLWKV